jgi:hypothetical protein
LGKIINEVDLAVRIGKHPIGFRIRRNSEPMEILFRRNFESGNIKPKELGAVGTLHL